MREVRTTQRPRDTPGPRCITGWCDTQCVSAEKGPRGKPLWIAHPPPQAKEPWIAGAFLPLLCKGMGSSMDFGDTSPLRAWQPSPAQPFFSPRGHFSSTAGGSHPQHRRWPWASCKRPLLCCGTCAATNGGRWSPQASEGYTSEKEQKETKGKPPKCAGWSVKIHMRGVMMAVHRLVLHKVSWGSSLPVTLLPK